jgi:hypothetical protein
MLFNLKPTFAGVKEALNVIALVDALLLTVVLSIPISLSRGDMAAINAMYNTGVNESNQTFAPSLWWTTRGVYGSQDSFQTTYDNISNMLGQNFTLSCCCLGASLMSIIITYLFGSVLDIEKDKERFFQEGLAPDKRSGHWQSSQWQ